MTTTVVHCKRDTYDVYVGRPSIWGNPFEIGKDGTREECVARYAEWIQAQPHLLAQLSNLRGKVLGCWCAPQPCHADVLANLADGADPEPAFGRIVLITGSRPAKPATLETTKTNEALCRAARAFVRTLPADTLVVTGYATGVDRASDLEARKAKLVTESWRVHRDRDQAGYFVIRSRIVPGYFSEPETLPDRFKSFGHAAYWRNARMVDMATEVWAFWDQVSPGTRNTIELAERVGKMRQVTTPHQLAV